MTRSPVELIKERLSILDVIGGYVELKHAGKSFKARSPFTNEKTPSFYVSPDRGMYYCFSSQKGGDMFTFIQEMEGVDFKGALKILAERANVELVPDNPKSRDALDTQYALLEEATVYFFEARESHPHANEYIGGRGVHMDTVHAWKIGYAKDEWRALRTYLKGKGFSDEQMLKAGLIKKTDQGKEPYDVFRDRIIFPIMDSSGRVVAFSGRTLKKEEGTPKYVNSPETELFQKSEILYGYNRAKQGIRQHQFSLIVEGQFDLVLAHQAGYVNTVAVSGTALTKYHIQLLLRLSPRVVLALDADRAGVSAVKRSAIPMLEAGMDVKVAHMPDGLDPADVVRKDPKELKRIVGKAIHVIEFLLQVLKTTSRDERTYKLHVREEILPLLIAIENRIDREHFEKIVAEYICGTKEGIHYEIERLDETRKRRSQQQGAPVIKESKDELPLSRKEALESHLQLLMSVCIKDREWIRDQIKTHLHTIISDRDFTQLVGKKESPSSLPDLFMIEARIENQTEREFLEEISDTLTQYAHSVAKEHLGALKTLIKDAELQRDDEKILILLSEAKKAEKLLQTHIVLQRSEL